MISKTKNIFLFGPTLPTQILKKAYGGGLGGYTRNMMTYLKHFKSKSYKIHPCYHTIRGQLFLDIFVWRFLIDTSNLLKALFSSRPQGIHILAQYRTATPREYVVCIISKIFRIPVLYEVKAGAFITWYNSTHLIHRHMIKFIMRESRLILVEGKPYLPFIASTFNRQADYFPNYVPDSEIPPSVETKLLNDTIKILFVGYCYRDKGIFELVEACVELLKKDLNIHLTIIGQEHPEFSSWLDNLKFPENLVIERLGRRPHIEVLENFKKHDVYCYPTRHGGEGHNNTINEAMMMGLVIVTTKQGFLGTILNNDLAYLMNGVSIKEIKNKLTEISEKREVARQKASKVYQHLKDNFSSSIAFEKLERHYEELTK